MKITFGISSIFLLLAAIAMLVMDFITYRQAKSFSSPLEAYKKHPKNWLVNLLFFLAIVFAFLFIHFDLNMDAEFKIGGNIKQGFVNLGLIFQPDWSFFFGYGKYSFQESVVWFIIKTFGIAYIGTLFAAIVALPFGLFASHKLFGNLAWPFEIILIAIRTLPEIIFALILVMFSGFSYVSGILVIGIHSIGMIGKLYADQIDGIQKEPMEGVLACGATKWQQIHLAVLPQIRPNLVSVALYRFDINIRTATILGIVLGADGGIGYYLSTQANHYHNLGACIIGILILVIGINAVSSVLRKRLL
ncbi:MAG TPA: hypothetical protein DCZ41_02730 [Firmicutes bacterium]|nr:hypothetical protein [Bacillota bacterium]